MKWHNYVGCQDYKTGLTFWRGMQTMNALKQQIQYRQQMLITDKENLRMLWGKIKLGTSEIHLSVPTTCRALSMVQGTQQ